MSLFEQFILQEAIPKKAKELGIAPEAPPDLTRPNAQPEDPNQQQDPNNPVQQDQGSPADVDPNAGMDNPAPEAQDPNMAGEDPAADPNAAPEDPGSVAGGEGDPNMEGDPNADPNAMQQDPNQLQGPDGVGGGDELQQADQELYAELKPEQRKIQGRELKERYQDLYKIVSESLDKLNKVNKTSFDANMLDVCMRNLVALKDLIYTSVTASFNTRTYVENKVELEKLTTMFNAITNMVSTIYEARLNRALKYDQGESKMDKIDFTQDLGF